jgi:peroxiredoxin
VDLQNDEGFLALGVPALSIAFDPAEEQAPAAAELGLDESKLLIDADGTVSEDYGVLEWAVATGEPGHTFVLIDEAGKVAWLQDFGAEENGGRMYVPMEELVEAIQSALTD